MGFNYIQTCFIIKTHASVTVREEPVVDKYDRATSSESGTHLHGAWWPKSRGDSRPHQATVLNEYSILLQETNWRYVNAPFSPVKSI